MVDDHRTDQENLARLRGLFVGQLDCEELKLFNRAVKLGCAERSYEGGAGFMGLAKVRLVMVPKEMPFSSMETVYLVDVEFARQLERELSAAIASLASANEQLAAERATMRRWQSGGGCVGTFCKADALLARAEQAEAAVLKYNDRVIELADRAEQAEARLKIAVRELEEVVDDSRKSAATSARGCVNPQGPRRHQRRQAMSDLIERLRKLQPADSGYAALGREAADALAARDREIAELRAELKAAWQDAQEDARNAATEATWKERLGDDYGSY